MPIKPRRSYRIIGLALLALGLTALLLFQPAVRRTVLDPVAEAIQSARYVLSFASQDQQWRAAMIMLAAMLAVVTLRFVARLPSEAKTDPRAVDQHESIEAIVRLLEGAERSPILHERLCQVLDQLLAHEVAADLGTSVPDARRLLVAGDAGLDPAVREFLYADRRRNMGPRRESYALSVSHVLTVIEQLQQEV